VLTHPEYEAEGFLGSLALAQTAPAEVVTVTPDGPDSPERGLDGADERGV
jgi:hypothetical protein